MERHPEAFASAKALEKDALEHGSPFTWSEGESLDDIAKPERIAEIKADHQKRLDRAKAKQIVDPLRPNSGLIDIDDLYGQQKMCLACHK